MSVVIFIVVLAVLILVHEFGHFIIAKRSGIRVDEFGLGFPPRLWGKKYGETEYTLNLIPFGGFVKIHGETPEADKEDADASRSLVNKPKYIQAAVMVGGVGFNFLLAWLLFTVGFTAGLPMSTASAPTGGEIRQAALTITGVIPDSPAAAELKTGDQIVKLTAADQAELLAPTRPEAVSAFIQEQAAGAAIDFEINRGGEILTVAVEPESGLVEDGPAVGIFMDEVGVVSLPWPLAIIQAANYTVRLTVAMTAMIGQLLFDLVTGVPVANAVVGPVGIVGLVGDAASLGWVYLLTFTALISVNLAIINLIPFPALDGGRLLFILIEAIKGSPIKPQIANTLNLIGFGLLLLLMAVVTYNDIARLF